MSLYKTIFLADDDSDDREIFMEAVKSIDDSIAFMSAKDGAAALLSLQNDIFQKPDLIFLDINMPFMNGVQLLTELKKEPGLRDIPVVMYSTFFSEEHIAEFRKLGAVFHLIKPIQFKELRKSLNEVLTTKW